MKLNFPLLALAVGAFGIGTTEFFPMGLLPVIAEGVNVSIPTAGMLITAYAVGVMIGAPLMTLLLSRRSPRGSLIFLMSIFTVGNILSGMSPDFITLLLSRLVTSLNHGAFFGLGSVVAASVVPKDKQASAVATMFMGLTIANIGGVPAATWLGQLIGWRMAFFATALLGVVAMLSLLFSLPKGEAGTRPNVRQELAVLTQPKVLMALLTTALGAGAMFTLYTYIAPVLEHIAAASPSFITVMLVLIGIGFSLGNYIGGRAADYSINLALTGALTLLVVVMLLIPYTITTTAGAAISMVIWGAATFGVVPPMQMRVMTVAKEAPGLAASVNIGAFNLGNALGAAAGGAVISVGLGYEYVSITGAIIALLGLVLVYIQYRMR